MSGERQTDRQTKSSRWSFTAYKDQWSLFEQMPPGIAEWGWQREVCPETNREHYQGYLRLSQQQRFAWLAKLLPGIHIEVARNWQALIAYCKKEDTRVPGSTPEHHTNSIPNHYQYADEVAKKYLAIYGKDDSDFWVWRNIPTTKEYARTNLISVSDRVDAIISADILAGKRYAAFIERNPNWEAVWKKWFKQFILSHDSIKHGQDGNKEEPRSEEG